MEMTNCPACLPPDNHGCATCNGTWSVEQSIADAFIAQKNELEALEKFKSDINQALFDVTTVEQARRRLLAFI